MDIKIIEAYEYKAEIRELFSEYTNMLAEGDPQFREYLKVQHFDDELADLKMKYGKPNGRLYIMFCDEKAAGCIGLRSMGDGACEMKRLYVRSEFRGQKLGERLVHLILKDAKAIGYKAMYLDTLPFLKTAQDLYKRLGFYEIPQYNDSPMDTATYMMLDL